MESAGAPGKTIRKGKSSRGTEKYHQTKLRETQQPLVTLEINEYLPRHERLNEASKALAEGLVVR